MILKRKDIKSVVFEHIYNETHAGLTML